jgi:hypothetical protein
LITTPARRLTAQNPSRFPAAFIIHARIWREGRGIWQGHIFIFFFLFFSSFVFSLNYWTRSFTRARKNVFNIKWKLIEFELNMRIDHPPLLRCQSIGFRFNLLGTQLSLFFIY